MSERMEVALLGRVSVPMEAASAGASSSSVSVCSGISTSAGTGSSRVTGAFLFCWIQEKGKIYVQLFLESTMACILFHIPYPIFKPAVRSIRLTRYVMGMDNPVKPARDSAIN